VRGVEIRTLIPFSLDFFRMGQDLIGPTLPGLSREQE